MDRVRWAKIFAPFDALDGFDEAVGAKLVQYEERHDLSECEKEELDQKTDHRLLFRRLGLIAEGIHEDYGFYQMNLFVDYDALEREKSLQGALAEIRTRFGRNGIFTGKNMLGGATQLERNAQIGGHRA